MDISYYLGFDINAQNYWYVAQLFSQPIDAPAFFSFLVSFFTAFIAHVVLLLLTGLFYRL